MASAELENLVKIGKLKREPPSETEFAGLLQSAVARLKDARNKQLALESRFDLAYNAAHALALAALRRAGYRSDNRYVAFQALPHSLGTARDVWRVLALAHDRRNRAEYEGSVVVDEQLVTDTIEAADVVMRAIRILVDPGNSR
jgi:hypothetical protein